jgi:hypothetical protein
MLTKSQKMNKIYKKMILKFRVGTGLKCPVFIFGAQRSGTNMLIDVLKKSYLTVCYDENDDEAFDNYVLRDMDVVENIINSSNADLVVFKPICDSQNASKILDAYPSSKAIWIYRDYHDVINSAVKRFPKNNHLHYMVNDKAKARWRIDNVDPREMTLAEKFYTKKVNFASIRGVVWYLRNILFYRQSLQSKKNVLLVNYERLVSDPKKNFEEIFSFLGIKFKTKYIEDIFTSSVSKDLPQDVDSEVEELCCELFGKLEKTLSEMSKVKR